jgi:hypothetical protein
MYNSLAGRYDNPIPTRFLTRMDCSKIPALEEKTTGLFAAGVMNIGRHFRGTFQFK